MDVSLSGTRVFFAVLALFSLTLISCGNRYDLSTERGRRARIDDANFHLSIGECSAAAEAIDPLFNSVYVDDEIRLIKASCFACSARFQLLTFVSNMAGATNMFKGLAKSLSNTTGDAARAAMYSAIDTLTISGSAINAVERSKTVNTYMVFLALGSISTIIRNYGSPGATDGSQGTNLIYDGVAGTAAGEMSDTDGCGLAAAFSTISNSYPLSELNDADTTAAVTAFNSLCVAAGFSSCAALSRNRTACGTGGTADAVNAALVVTGVNGAW